MCASEPAGYSIVSAASAYGPGGRRSVTANCPANKRVIGSGVALDDGWRQISVDNLLVGDTGVTAYGIDDQVGYADSWSITAYAVCADPLPGLQHVNTSSAANSDSPKVTNANCPAGKNATGQGWAMSGDGQVYVEYAGITPGGVSHVAYEDDDGYTGNWSEGPQLLCATA